MDGQALGQADQAPAGVGDAAGEVPGRVDHDRARRPQQRVGHLPGDGIESPGQHHHQVGLDALSVRSGIALLSATAGPSPHISRRRDALAGEDVVDGLPFADEIGPCAREQDAGRPGNAVELAGGDGVVGADVQKDQQILSLQLRQSATRRIMPPSSSPDDIDDLSSRARRPGPRQEVVTGTVAAIDRGQELAGSVHVNPGADAPGPLDIPRPAIHHRGGVRDQVPAGSIESLGNGSRSSGSLPHALVTAGVSLLPEACG